MNASSEAESADYIISPTPFPHGVRVLIKPEPETPKEWIELEIGGETIARANILREGRRVTVKFITVHPSHERQGVAGSILAELKKNHSEIVAQGVKYQARGFWEKCGFQRMGKTKNWRWTSDSPSFPP